MLVDDKPYDISPALLDKVHGRTQSEDDLFSGWLNDADYDNGKPLLTSNGDVYALGLKNRRVGKRHQAITGLLQHVWIHQDTVAMVSWSERAYLAHLLHVTLKPIEYTFDAKKNQYILCNGSVIQMI